MGNSKSKKAKEQSKEASGGLLKKGKNDQADGHVPSTTLDFVNIARPLQGQPTTERSSRSILTDKKYQPIQEDGTQRGNVTPISFDKTRTSYLGPTSNKQSSLLTKNSATSTRQLEINHTENLNQGRNSKQCISTNLTSKKQDFMQNKQTQPISLDNSYQCLPGGVQTGNRENEKPSTLPPKSKSVEENSTPYSNRATTRQSWSSECKICSSKKRDDTGISENLQLTFISKQSSATKSLQPSNISNNQIPLSMLDNNLYGANSDCDKRKINAGVKSISIQPDFKGYSVPGDVSSKKPLEFQCKVNQEDNYYTKQKTLDIDTGNKKIETNGSRRCRRQSSGSLADLVGLGYVDEYDLLQEKKNKDSETSRRQVIPGFNPCKEAGSNVSISKAGSFRSGASSSLHSSIDSDLDCGFLKENNSNNNVKENYRVEHLQLNKFLNNDRNTFGSSLSINSGKSGSFLLGLSSSSRSSLNSSIDEDLNCGFVEENYNTNDTDAKADESSSDENVDDNSEIDKWRSRMQEVALRFQSESVNLTVSKDRVFLFKIIAVMETDDDVTDLIRSRLPKNFKFELCEINPKRRITIVALKFPSKRMALRTKTELHQSNKRCHVKIWMIGEKPQSTIPTEVSRIGGIFQQYVDGIIKRAESSLYAHNQKIENARMKLNEVKKQMGKQKFLKLECFQMINSERQAMKDQLMELQLQQKEFNSFMEQLSTRLSAIDVGAEWEMQIQEMKKSFGVECLRLRDALPIYARRSDIQKTIKENKVSIILGETGSGKSTQLPQYIYGESWVGNGLIVCTQPRKVAAVSLAERVASEMATSVGQEVGYHVGMNMKKSKSTKIVYMTDHCLLNQCLKDNTLSAYSCIIVDEAHERSIFTDLLLGMIKRRLAERDDLRVIITSATIDPDVFQKYFNNCPVMKVSGRMFPVQVVWKEAISGQEPFEDYENHAVKKAIDIHLNEPEGDVLVFLTSPLEAENCCNSFQDKVKDNAVICLQLHSKIQPSEQRRVFQHTPKGMRKIVFATNSAETSITIPNIRYVIDTGLMKENRYDPVRNLSTLSVTMITKSNAEQRKGRAGRTVAGKCYRLYTEHDYQSMKPNNIPELLRIHLGQAILKLFELSVNPFDFEFVQSPNRQSMESTLCLLEDIGAIKQQAITELGKWISKLPVDPKFGAFIYEGLQNDIAVEAVVIAAFVSAAGSVFYRGGSQAQKDVADRKKTKFCHPGGDFLSYLNVFREWFKQPERTKGKWCVDNAINGKTMRGVRETINEILLILRKEHKEHIKLEFTKTDDTSDSVLQKLLFRALKSNVSHFLGHQGAGYLYIEKDQQIHLHPSSCLLALGCSPEWIVFLKLMRSSRDYAMEVVSVSDEVLHEAIREGWILVDIDEVKRRRISPVFTFHVGSHIFWEFVGPRYTNLRNLETEFLEIIDGSPGVIEADKIRGQIKVYAPERYTDVAKLLLTEELEPLIENLRYEESEQKLSPHTDKIRALIGPGGSVLTLYMPNQYKTVDIYCTPRIIQCVNDEFITDFFEYFGTIQNFWLRKVERKSAAMCFLGKITFDTVESAIDAVDGTKCNDEIQVRSPIRDNGTDLTGFKAVLTWCRRPSKGFGFVELLKTRHIHRALSKGFLSVGGSKVFVNRSRNNDRELWVKNLGKMMNEDVLRQGMADSLNIDAFAHIGRVTIVREKVETTKSDLSQYQRRLKGTIAQYVKHGRFEIELRTPKQADHNYLAYVKFSDPDDGDRACREISYSVTFNGEIITMKADLSTSIYIHKNIYDRISEEVEICLENEEEINNVKTKIKQLKSGNYVIDLHASSPEELASSKREIHMLIRGDKLTSQQDQRSNILFTRNGKERLRSIMRTTNTFINVDNRVMEITVHGSSRNKDRARKEIDKYLSGVNSLSSKQIELKGEDKPVGVMKALLIKYGIDLGKLVIDAGLANTELDLRNHLLRLIGSDKAIETGCSMINDVISSIQNNLSLLRDNDDPECVVCQTPVDDYEELYRLECCGHPYHKDCIELQITSAVRNKDFPISCCLQDCECHFAWKDVLNLARFGYTSISDLVASSVSSFVSKHNDGFRYCITPDCPIVYKASRKGKCFRCPDCEIRLCTSCHIQFHDGLTCAMYKSEKGDKSIAVWIRGDPDRRKLCPNCCAPIEKNGGCNHMECLSCRKHICWVCMQFFNKCRECYGHLAKAHGSYM